MGRPLSRDGIGTKDAGEVRAGTTFFGPGLQDVEDHAYATGLPRPGGLDVHALEALVLQNQPPELLQVHMEPGAVKLRLGAQIDVGNGVNGQFQSHSLTAFRRFCQRLYFRSIIIGP